MADNELLYPSVEKPFSLPSYFSEQEAEILYQKQNLLAQQQQTAQGYVNTWAERPWYEKAVRNVGAWLPLEKLSIGGFNLGLTPPETQALALSTSRDVDELLRKQRVTIQSQQIINTINLFHAAGMQFESEGELEGLFAPISGKDWTQGDRDWILNYARSSLTFGEGGEEQLPTGFSPEDLLTPTREAVTYLPQAEQNLIASTVAFSKDISEVVSALQEMYAPVIPTEEEGLKKLREYVEQAKEILGLTWDDDKSVEDNYIMLQDYMNQETPLDQMNWLQENDPRAYELNMEQYKDAPLNSDESRQLLITALSSVSTENIDMAVRYFTDDPEALKTYLVEAGRNYNTNRIVKLMYPDITEEQMRDYFLRTSVASEVPPYAPRLGAPIPESPIWSTKTTPLAPGFEQGYNVLTVELTPAKDELMVMGESLQKLPKQIGASVLQAVQGENGASVVNRDWADEYIQLANKDLEAFAEQIRWQYPDSTMLQEASRLSQNLAYSLTSMGAGTLAALPLWLAPEPTATTKIAASAVTGVVSGAISYRMTTYQIVQQYLEFKDAEKRAQTGQGLTLDEENQLKEEFHSKAVQYGLWEAVPEGISNMLFSGILTDAFTSTLTRVVGQSAAKQIASSFGMKAISKVAGIYGEEFLTETITQKGQAAIEAEAGLREGNIGWWDAFKEIAPQTFLLTTIMAGAGQTIVSSTSAIKKVRASAKAELGEESSLYKTVDEKLEAELTPVFEAAKTEAEATEAKVQQQKEQKVIQEKNFATTQNYFKDAVMTKNWAVISAWANAKESKSLAPSAIAELNKKRGAELISYMTQQTAYNYHPTMWMDKGVKGEQGIFVEGITDAEAREIGTMFKQDTVLTPRGYIYADGTYNPADLSKASVDGLETAHTRINIRGENHSLYVPVDENVRLKIEVKEGLAETLKKKYGLDSILIDSGVPLLESAYHAGGVERWIVVGTEDIMDYVGNDTDATTFTNMLILHEVGHDLDPLVRAKGGDVITRETTAWKFVMQEAAKYGLKQNDVARILRDFAPRTRYEGLLNALIKAGVIPEQSAGLPRAGKVNVVPVTVSSMNIPQVTTPTVGVVNIELENKIANISPDVYVFGSLMSKPLTKMGDIDLVFPREATTSERQAIQALANKYNKKIEVFQADEVTGFVEGNTGSKQIFTPNQKPVWEETMIPKDFFEGARKPQAPAETITGETDEIIGAMNTPPPTDIPSMVGKTPIEPLKPKSTLGTFIRHLETKPYAFMDFTKRTGRPFYPRFVEANFLASAADSTAAKLMEERIYRDPVLRKFVPKTEKNIEIQNRVQQELQARNPKIVEETGITHPILTADEMKLANTLESIYKSMETDARTARFFLSWMNNKGDVDAILKDIPNGNVEDFTEAGEFITNRDYDGLRQYLDDKTWGTIRQGFTAEYAYNPSLYRRHTFTELLGAGHLKIRENIPAPNVDTTIIERTEKLVHRESLMVRLAPVIHDFDMMLEAEANKPNGLTPTELKDMENIITAYLHDLQGIGETTRFLPYQVMMNFVGQTYKTIFNTYPHLAARNILQPWAFHPDRAAITKYLKTPMTEFEKVFFGTFTTQMKGISEGMLLGGDTKGMKIFSPLNRLADKLALYAHSDTAGRYVSFHGSFQKALAANQKYLASGRTVKDFNAWLKDSSVWHLEPQQRAMAKAYLESTTPISFGAPGMTNISPDMASAAYIANEMTGLVHFYYSRAMRGAYEHGDVGKILFGLTTFPKSYAERVILQTQKAFDKGLPGNLRAAAFGDISKLFIAGILISMAYSAVTGRKTKAYNPLDMFNWEIGGIVIGTLRDLGTLVNDVFHAIRGDTASQNSLYSKIGNEATGIGRSQIPWLQQTLYFCETAVDKQYIDREFVKKFISLIDKNYSSQEQEKMNRTAWEEVQHALFGGGNEDVAVDDVEAGRVEIADKQKLLGTLDAKGKMYDLQSFATDVRAVERGLPIGVLAEEFGFTELSLFYIDCEDFIQREYYDKYEGYEKKSTLRRAAREQNPNLDAIGFLWHYWDTLLTTNAREIVDMLNEYYNVPLGARR